MLALGKKHVGAFFIIFRKKKAQYYRVKVAVMVG